ncbi:hypothetical protein V2G26_006362 [Clonostachys chloroleuca]
MTVQHHDGIIPTEHDALLPRPLQPPAGDSEPGVLAQDDPFASGDVVTAEEHRSFQRGLEQRHLSMIGIAGAIGTGLFLGLGGAVQTGGPLGALLGYGVIGLVVCAVQFALGEVAALLPVTGSYVRHAEFLVDPAWGVALGYNLVYGNILSIPSEITAICVLFRFWWPDVDPTPIILVFILLTLAVGLARIHVFGEVEYLFAWLKVLLIVFLIVLGLLIALGAIPGTPALGFRYWRDPGPFVEHIFPGTLGNFLGFWQALAGAVFSFAGVESIAMAAAETRDPRSAIPAACKRVFLRIFLFYMLAILVVGMLVASNDPRLANGPAGDAAQSPFVIAASAAGIPFIPRSSTPSSSHRPGPPPTRASSPAPASSTASPSRARRPASSSAPRAGAPPTPASSSSAHSCSSASSASPAAPSPSSGGSSTSPPRGSSSPGPPSCTTTSACEAPCASRGSPSPGSPGTTSTQCTPHAQLCACASSSCSPAASRHTSRGTGTRASSSHRIWIFHWFCPSS